MNKSRPAYLPFSIDPSARFHLIVTDRVAALPSDDLSCENFEVWIVARGVPEMLTDLRHRLARETIGLRLYAVGAEAFLWDVYNVARGEGLAGEEIRLSKVGPNLRRVYCAHCKTMIENAAVNLVACPGCGPNLFVRDHFSRRLAAFMGVKIDAEVPGEIFVPEPFET